MQIRGGELDVDVNADAQNLLTVHQRGQERLKAPGLTAELVFVDPTLSTRRRYAMTLADTQPQVVVQTANRVVVRLAGKFLDEQQKVISELILFVEILRQSPEIRLQPVWIYLGHPQEDLVASLTLTVHRPLKTEEACYAFSNERGPGHWDMIQRVKIPDVGDGPRWPLARQVQVGSSFYVTEKATAKTDVSWVKAVEGQKGQGWCFLTDKSFGLTAAMRYFWQEYPHSLAVDCDEGTISFGLVPAEARPGGLAALLHADVRRGDVRDRPRPVQGRSRRRQRAGQGARADAALRAAGRRCDRLPLAIRRRAQRPDRRAAHPGR